MMYCNQCGRQIPDDAKFCHHCGSAIGKEQTIETKEEPQMQKAIEDTEPIPQDQLEKPKKEKSKKAFSGNRKTLMIVTVAVIAVLAAAIAGIHMVKNHQPVLAELPDPEYYFSSVGIDEIKEKNDVKTVILRSDENIWNYAAGYVNLLKWSGRYPVTQSDEERYSSGDYMWNFVYNDRDDIKSPYFCQVEVNYYNKSNGRDKYAVWITMHDIDAFDLVQKEQYTESDATADFSGTSGTDNPGSTDNSNTDDSSMNSVPESNTTSETPITDSSSNVFEDGFEEDDDDNDDFEVYEAEDIYDNPTPCGVCDGDGDCQTCSGDGYLMSSASDEEDRNCYSCSGSGNCRSCGGDGEL